MDAERHPILLKEKSINYGEDRKKMSSPREVISLMNEVFSCSSLAEEYLYLLCLDTKCHLLGVFEVTHGTVDSSLVSPREVYQRALLCGACGIILVHNHPSGDPAPSKEDIKATERIRESGKILNIPLQDHIIIGENDFFSFAYNEM